MRKLILPCCIVLLAACSNKHNEGDHNDRPQTATAVATSHDDIQAFTGSINNKIPVSLWYVVQDSIVSGELVYTNTKDKKPIRLVGKIGPEDIFIDEFLPDGMLSGIWSGKISGNTFSGTWSGKKDLPFTLQRTENSQAHNQDMFTAGNITGSYNYNYSDDGGMSTLDVKKLDDGRIVYNIEAVGHGPGYNQATVEDDTLVLNGNEAIYEASDEFGKCNYRIRFYKDFAIIDSPKDEYECGFGAGATVNGIYLKTSDQYASFHID